MGEDPASPATDLPRPSLGNEGDGDRGAALSVVVSGVVVGVVVGIAVVVAGVVTCRARRGLSPPPGKSHHQHPQTGAASRDDLLQQGALFHSYASSHPSVGECPFSSVSPCSLKN